MKEIRERVNELIGLCEIRLKKVETERNDLNGLRHQLEQQKKEQAEKQAWIAEEHQKWRARKIIAETIEHANAILKESSEMKESLARRQADFEIARRGLERDRVIFENEIRTLRRNLDKERKNMKKELLKEIGKNKAVN